MQGLFKMFRLNNNTTALTYPPEDDLAAEVEEPPDDLSPLDSTKPFFQPERRNNVSTTSAHERKESLLTRALMQSPPSMPHDAPRSSTISRGPSSFSTQSTASTAELTSDCDMTSPARTASPSPPLPPTRLPPLATAEKNPKSSHIVVAPTSKDQLPSIIDNQESRVEADLGRKRRVMFACGRRDPQPVPKQDAPVQADPPKRKCMLTFACPTRASKERQSLVEEVLKDKNETTKPI